MEVDTPTPLPVVVGGIVNEKNEILLIRRVNTPFADYWALPGGKWEKGELVGQAFLREIYEETACEIEDSYLAAIVSVRIIDNTGDVLDHYILFFHIGYAYGAHIHGEHEKSYLWVDNELFSKESDIEIPPVDRKLIELYLFPQNESKNKNNGELHFYEAVIQEVAPHTYELRAFQGVDS